jgi:hypothetical protein
MTYWLFHEIHWNHLSLKLFDDDVTNFNVIYLVHYFSFQTLHLLRHTTALEMHVEVPMGANSTSQRQIDNKL